MSAIVVDQVRFDGQVVVVSGAGNGLGRAHAIELGRLGASVVVNDLGTDVTGVGASRAPADAVVAEIVDRGGIAVASYASVGSAAGAAEIIACALDSFGRVDAVIHNAGIVKLKGVEDVSPEDVERHLDVHLRGGVYLTTAAYPHMRKQGYGRFVYTSSQAVFGGEGLLGYATAKGGLFGLCNVVAVEGEEHNIVANVVFPTATTRMPNSLTQGQARTIRASATLPKRDEDPLEDVSAFVVYLASRSCTTTGNVLYACSGRFGRVVTGVLRPWVTDGAATPDDVQKHIEQIMTADVIGYPKSSAEFGRSIRAIYFDLEKSEG